MKIGKLEIRWGKRNIPIPWAGASDTDYSGAFAVVEAEAWWLAVNQIVDQAELETIAGARRATHDANRCIAAVGAGEGCDLIRTKLKEARAYALASYREDVKGKA